jgi:PIN domain nuclease of toxin-antitoxin system
MSIGMLNDTELRIRGIEILNESLGIAAALRFLSLLHREPTDYVAISRRLYEGQTVDDIFDRARENWPPDAEAMSETSSP